MLRDSTDLAFDAGSVHEIGVDVCRRFSYVLSVEVVLTRQNAHLLLDVEQLLWEKFAF
jgi:hypothetical protein